MNKKDVNGKPGKLEDANMTVEVQKQGLSVGGHHCYRRLPCAVSFWPFLCPAFAVSKWLLLFFWASEFSVQCKEEVIL